uniref:Uncharacterized protein n=1 Tax=Arundo donax TaxID=35708 RepID=A0A0A9HNV1_ARUDO
MRGARRACHRPDLGEGRGGDEVRRGVGGRISGREAHRRTKRHFVPPRRAPSSLPPSRTLGSPIVAVALPLVRIRLAPVHCRRLACESNGGRPAPRRESIGRK